MDWLIEHIDGDGYVRAALGGPLEVSEIARFIDDLTIQDFWHPGRPLLIDDARLEVENVGTAEIESLSRLFTSVTEEYGKGRVAILANSDVQYGLARQFQITAETDDTAEIGVFTSEDEAASWLSGGEG